LIFRSWSVITDQSVTSLPVAGGGRHRDQRRDALRDRRAAVLVLEDRAAVLDDDGRSPRASIEEPPPSAISPGAARSPLE
jgi:hypothetical protein